MVNSPIVVDHRTYYICCEVGHLAKDCPCYVIKATLISAVRGRATIRGMIGRGSGAYGSGHGATQPIGGRC